MITGLLYLALSRATTFGEFLVINGMFGDLRWCFDDHSEFAVDCQLV